MKIINSLLNIPSAHPDDARRRTLLTILLLGVGGLALLGLVATFIIDISGLVSHQELVAMFLYQSCIAAIAGGLIIYAINRYWSGLLASSLFVVLLTILFAFGDEPQQVTSGRSLFMFAIPVLMASVLLRPWASFLIAGLVSLIIAAIEALVLHLVPNVPAMLGFFTLALVSWLSARSLERAIVDLRTLNRELDQRVADRTRDLDESLTNEQTANEQLQQEIAERKQIEEALRVYQRQLEVSYQREQERLRLSNTLREVAKIVSGSLEQQRVLDLILTQLEKVVTYHYAAVTLLIGDELTLVAGRDKMGGAVESFTIPANQYPLNATVLRERQPLLVPDVTRDERWQAGEEMGLARSYINAPLLVKDRPIGLLGVGRSDETPYTEEDTQIVFAFASQVAVALESARLHEYELAQIERELAIARQIQMSLLPSNAPDVHGLDIAGFSQAARQVGGDFYNYFMFDQGHLGIAVGDVSGKGMQSALMMALSFGLLANQVRHDVAPAALLAELNMEIHPHTQRSKLNTALCYLAMKRSSLPPRDNQRETWELHTANAGLIAPLMRRPDGKVEWLDVKGWPLGMAEGIEYKESRQALVPGSRLIVSSDGIVEAMNTASEMYGFDRLVQRFAAAPADSAQALLEWILTDVRAFVSDAETHDDLTLVVMVVEDA